MSSMWNDLRYTVRRLLKTPGFLLIAVAILGLGIGANTVVFSIINAVYLDDPAHIRDLDRLVRVYGVDDRAGVPTSMPYPDFAYFDENQRSFDGFMGWGHSIALTVGHSDTSEAARGMFVSHDYFDVLGARPAAGRWFLADEDSVAAPQMAAVVSHGFWSNALGASANAVGQTIYLNGLTFVIVGIAPEGFAGPSPMEIAPDIWIPFHTVPSLSPRDWEMIERPARGGWNWVQAIARLRDDVTIDAARGDLEGLSAQLRESFPVQVNQRIALNDDARFLPHNGSSFAGMLRLMLLAAGAVLVAGTANVAVLLSVRASEATKDAAVSKALGASGTRIARSALLESLVLGGLGAAVGIWLAYAISGVAASILPATFSVSFEPDLLVVTFACLLALTVAIASGLIPALRTAHVDVNRVLKGDDRSGRARSPMRSGLVVVQVAVAAIMILGAALTARSVATTTSIPFGFDQEDRTLLSVSLGNHGYSPEEGQAFVREALDRLRGLPGVLDASTLSNVPFLVYYSEKFQHPSTDETAPSANMGVNAVSSGFFAAMGIGVRMGRGIDETDIAGGIPSIVVSETTARSLWPDENPIGQQLYGRPDQPLWEVVGVAEDARFRDLDRAPEFYGYTALTQDYRSDVTFVVHGEIPSPLLRDALYDVDPSIAISDTSSMEQVISLVAMNYRSPALLMNVLGAMSLLLAIVGLYGVLSYTVAGQRREIGIRMALGSSSQNVALVIVRRALRLVLLGLAIGGAVAWLAAPVLGSFLFGVEPRDLAVWISALLALFLVGAAASAIPAHRAASLNPADALRR